MRKKFLVGFLVLAIAISGIGTEAIAAEWEGSVSANEVAIEEASEEGSESGVPAEEENAETLIVPEEGTSSEEDVLIQEAQPEESEVVVSEFEDIEEPVVVLEERVSLEEAVEKLPETIEAVDAVTNEVVEVSVEWECMDDYADTELASYVFVPVIDEAAEVIVAEEDLPRMEIYYGSEYQEQISSTGLAVSAQKLSENTLIFDEAEDQTYSDAYMDANTASASERAFWESLDLDICHNLTSDQAEFYARLDQLLDQYLYNGKAATVLKDGTYSTAQVNYSDLSSLKWNNQDSANSVIMLAESYLECHPQYFFVTTSFYGNDSGMGLNFLPSFIKPADRTAARKSIQSEILSITDKYSDSSHVTATGLHDDLCNRVSYDYYGNSRSSGSQSSWTPGNIMWDQSMASVFYESSSDHNRTTVCAGYSQAYMALCNLEGIPSFSITSTSHQWNKVQLYGSWYCVDTTWDDRDYATPSHQYLLKKEITDSKGSESHDPRAFWKSLLLSTEYATADFNESMAYTAVEEALGDLTIMYQVSGDERLSNSASSYSVTVSAGESYTLLGSTGVTGPTVSRYGYVLAGWTDPAGKTYKLNTAYTDSNTEASQLILKPKWSVRTYKISYNYDGGSKGSKAPASFKGSASTVTISNPVKGENKFKEWSFDGKSIGSSGSYDISSFIKDATVNATGIVRLEAVWTPVNSYSVSFASNAGEAVSKPNGAPDSSWDRNKSYVIDVPLPSFSGYAGYQFLGYAKKAGSKTATYKPSATTGKITLKNLAKAGGSVTLYEVWKESWEYTVNYHANGGEFDVSSASVTQAVDALESKVVSGSGSVTSGTGIYYGNMYYASPIPARAGYTFAGWTLNGASSTKLAFKYNTKTGRAMVRNAVAKNNASYPATLWAVWKPITYKIVYVMNGGTKGNKTATKFTTTTKQISITKPSRKGYTFAGWYLDNELIEEGEAAFKLDVPNYIDRIIEAGALKLVARWTPITYKVVYYGNGGNIGSDYNIAKSYRYNVSYQSLNASGSPAVTRAGYTLSGWSKSKNGKVAYKPGASVKNLSAKNNGTVKLYAIWKRVK